jgi:hypothetical protein
MSGQDGGAGVAAAGRAARVRTAPGRSGGALAAYPKSSMTSICQGDSGGGAAAPVCR